MPLSFVGSLRNGRSDWAISVKDGLPSHGAAIFYRGTGLPGEPTRDTGENHA
jgi:hypothetical protein